LVRVRPPEKHTESLGVRSIYVPAGEASHVPQNVWEGIFLGVFQGVARFL